MGKSIPIVGYDLNLSAKQNAELLECVVKYKPIVMDRFEIELRVWPDLREPGAWYTRQQLCRDSVLRKLTDRYQMLAGPYAPFYPTCEQEDLIDATSEAMVRAIAKLTDPPAEGERGE